MTERTVAELEPLLYRAELDLSTAQDRYSRLRKELDAARIREASHPWLGKRVERRVPPRWKNSQARTERGILAVYDPALHHSRRNLYTYRLEAGTPIVLHEGGVTAYNFDEAGGWRLAEESSK